MFFHLSCPTAQVQVSLCLFSPPPTIATYQPALVHRPVACIVGQSMQTPLHGFTVPLGVLKMELEKAPGKPHKAG